MIVAQFMAQYPDRHYKEQQPDQGCEAVQALFVHNDRSRNASLRVHS